MEQKHSPAQLGLPAYPLAMIYLLQKQEPKTVTIPKTDYDKLKRESELLMNPVIEKPVELTPIEIMQIVGNYLEDAFSLTRGIFLEPTRNRKVVAARQIFCYICLTYELTTVAVGAYLKQDHSTIIHSRNTVRNLSDTESEYRLNLKVHEHNVSNLITRSKTAVK